MRKFFSPHCPISKWEIFMVISSNFNMSEIYFHNKDFASTLFERRTEDNSEMAYSLRRRAKARNVTIGDFHSALLPISFPEFSIPLSSETGNERVSSLSFPVPLDKFIEDSGNEICSTSPTTRCSSPLESLKTLP